LHDIMPGVMPNGLFWTMQIPDHTFRVSNGGRVARLNMEGLPLVDTYQFGGSLNVPVILDLDLTWRGRGRPQPRGSGSSADAEAPDAFEGEFLDAVAGGRVSGWEPGVSFRSNRLTSTTFYASMGHERNGVYLS
jgi:hypothetical protein